MKDEGFRVIHPKALFPEAVSGHRRESDTAPVGKQARIEIASVSGKLDHARQIAEDFDELEVLVLPPEFAPVEVTRSAFPSREKIGRIAIKQFSTCPPDAGKDRSSIADYEDGSSRSDPTARSNGENHIAESADGTGVSVNSDVGRRRFLCRQNCAAAEKGFDVSVVRGLLVNDGLGYPASALATGVRQNAAANASTWSTAHASVGYPMNRVEDSRQNKICSLT